MQCEITSAGKKAGFLRAERQGLYTRFYGEVETKDVTKVYGVFEGGECALGIPVPEKGKMVLRVSLPTSKLPGGRLISGRLPSNDVSWRHYPGGIIGGICYPEGMKNGDRLRFQWRVGMKLPTEEALLFYRYGEQGGKGYLELKLEADGSICTGKE